MDQGSNTTRPAVLENATETQIQELEQHYAEQDQSAWRRLTDSYGWSQEDSEAVWQWFGEKPEG